MWRTCTSSRCSGRAPSLGSDAPNVVGLVYVAGFGLDEGESIGALLAQGPPTPAIQQLRLDAQGFADLQVPRVISVLARPGLDASFRIARSTTPSESPTIPVTRTDVPESVVHDLRCGTV